MAPDSLGTMVKNKQYMVPSVDEKLFQDMTLKEAAH